MIYGINSFSTALRWVVFLMISMSSISAFEEGDLVITEYFVKSNGAIPDYVEIYNTTDVDINLLNWTIGIGVAELNYYTITQSFFIPKHEYVFFSGEEGYFTGSSGGEDILYLPSFDMRIVSPCSDPDIYDEGDCTDAGGTWAEDTDFDEDFYEDTEGLTILEISTGYWLPFIIINSQGIFEIQDPSGNFIDGYSFIEGNGCPEFGSGSTNRGHAVELKLDPNVDTMEDLNNDCANWEISNQTPRFMLNEHPDVEWYGGDGTQEWGSPGYSNHTPINVAINEGGEFSYTISWESSHPNNDLDVTHFNIYRDNVAIAQVDSSQSSYENGGLSEGFLYYYQLSALNSDESIFTDSLAVSLPDAFAGVDQEVNIALGDSSIDVELNGSFSDPEGDETTYEWTLDGNVISTDLVSIQTLESGEYNYTLKVTDSHGGFSIDGIQITVNSPLTAVITYPMVYEDAIHDGDLGGNGLVTLDGTGSVASEGHLITQWLWYELLDTEGDCVNQLTEDDCINGEFADRCIWEVDVCVGEEEFIIIGELVINQTIEVGSHNIILEVQDDQAPPIVARDTVDVTIVEPNDPPIAVAGDPQTISIPHDGVDGVEPSSEDPFDYLPSFNVSGDLSYDPDILDVLVSYVWSLNDSTLSDISNYTGTLPDEGIYDIILSVQDPYGSTDADTITITVNEEPNIAPNAVVEADTITAQVSESPGVPGGTTPVFLNNFADESHGYSNDEDGDPITLRWGIDSNKNGIWEYGEPYSDDNCNGKYDEGEEFTDEDGNLEFTINEPSTVSFQNLEADEPYVDVNYNGELDGEPFKDCGLDGLCDEDEPGYNEDTNLDPNGDNYHPVDNPGGTEGNNEFEVGEVFQDIDNSGSFDGGEPFNDVNNNDVWDDGIYEFILTVLDPYCATDAVPMNVLVFEENSPPEIIESLEDQEVMENTQVILTGNAYDEDNPDDLIFLWIAGNELVDILDPTDLDTEFISPNLETNEPLIIEIIFEISDPFNETDRDTILVTVLNSNGSPDIINPLPDFAVLEDATDTTIIITEIFEDPDQDEITYSLENANGDILLATLTDSSIHLDYFDNQFGSADIILTADDGVTRGSSSDTMSVTINPVNDAPVINSTAPDSATEDIEYLYQVFWDDPDDTEFSFTLFDAPDGMFISDSGLVSWIPGEDVLTSDVVTFQLDDSGGSEGVIQSDLEEFTILVTPVNDSPQIVSTAPDSAYEDIEYVYELDILDPDDDEFTFILFNAPDGMEIDISGIITWTPLEGEITTGLVTVRASDGGEDDSEPSTEDFEVFVNAINDPPVILSGYENELIIYEDINQEIEQDSLEIDDPDNEDFSIIILSGENYNFDGGILIPEQNYFGELIVPIVVSDGIDTSNVFNLEVIVESVNDPPLFTIDKDTILVDEDFVVSDIIAITPSPQLENESEQTINYTLEPSGASLANVMLDTDAMVISFFAVTDSFGTMDFFIKATDDGGINNGGIDTTLVEFTLIVNSINDLPTFSLSEIDIELEEDFSDDAVITIINYEDIENDPPLFYLTPDIASWADLIIDSETGEITISAVPDSSGEMDFTVTAIDDPDSETGTDAFFSLLINSVNDSPFFNLSEVIFLVEDFIDTITVSIQDFHEPDFDDVIFTIDPDTVSWAEIIINSVTGDIQIIALPDSSGEQIFIVSADDGQNEDNSIFTREFTLYIKDQNDPPLFDVDLLDITLNEDFTISDTIFVIPQAVPPNETWQTVSYSIVPEEVSFVDIVIDSQTGKTHFEVIQDASGYQEFQIKATDNGDTLYFGIDTALVSIALTIEAVNDNIVLIQDIEDLELDEDSEPMVIELENYFSDIENTVEDLVLSYIVDPNSILGINLVTFEKNGEDLLLSLIPNANDTADVTIILSDLGDNPNESFGDTTILSISSTFRLLVNQVFDPDTVTDVSIHEPIPEDTMNYHFFISYENFDADTNLNAYPVDATTLSIDTTLGLSDTANHLIGIVLIDSLTQEWKIGSLFPDWNGIDSLAIITSAGDTTFWEIEASPVNDAPVIQSAYFTGELSTISEDTTQIQFLIEYDDVDADPDLNLNPFDISNLVWEFQTPNTSTGQHFFASYDTTAEMFWLDSLLDNWNGPDSLQIIVTDTGQLSDTFYFQIFVEQVIDPPVVHAPVFEDGTASIPEDTSLVNFIIGYENIDADPSLNYLPIGIDTIFVDPDHNIFQGITFVEDNQDFSSLSQIWNIEMLLNNWNGNDSLKVKLQNLEGLQDSIYFPVNVYQINDIPEIFEVDVIIDTYGIDLSTYYDLSTEFPEEESILNFRLPFIDSPVNEQDPVQLLLKWNRTEDYDTDATLNNDVRFDLYYRIELTTDNSDLNYIIGDSIPDSVFFNGSACDILLASVLESNASFCETYSFLTDSQFAFYSIDLTDSFPAYPNSVLYTDADLESKLLLDLNGETQYTWQVIAQNYELDSRNNDLEQVNSAEENPFYIDLTLPTAEFYMMQNEMFTEYFDMYIFSSDSIYDFLALNQPILILLDPLTPRLDYSPVYLSNGIYHLSSNFDTTGILTMEFQGRDRVQNFGKSIDSVSYQIVSSTTLNRFSSPSGLAEITIPPGALSQESGIVIMEYPIVDLDRNTEYQVTPAVCFSPVNLQFEINATISLKVDESISEIGEPWQIQIYKEVYDEWTFIPTRFEGGLATSEITSLGNYAVFINFEAEYEELVILPEKFDLKPAFPNPFNPITTISFDLPVDSNVKITIYDINGRVISVFTSEWYQAGQHTLNWDAERQSSGVYFIHMNAGSYNKTNKVVFLK